VGCTLLGLSPFAVALWGLSVLCIIICCYSCLFDSFNAERGDGDSDAALGDGDFDTVLGDGEFWFSFGY